MKFVDVSRLRTRFAEPVPARDGTELSVDLYLPPEEGRYPVLLTRTPYDNNRMARATPGTVGLLAAPADRFKKLAAHGYIVAAADVRGRGDADGNFVPFVHEATDGADTVAWLRGLDEGDGRVGAFGSGYAAYCAWAAAAESGGVDAVVSASPFGAPHRGLPDRGGVVRLDWLFWMHLTGGRTLQPADVPPWRQIFRSLPLSGMDEALGRSDIWWKEWLDHLDADDEYWTVLDVAERVAGLAVPALHLTGWWDQQLAAALDYWDAGVRSGAPQRLVIGPWDTTGVRQPRADTGGVEWGPTAVVDPDELLLAFFDAHFKDGDATAPAAARVFVTGRNGWENVPVWPPDETAELHLHLSSGGRANTRRGDGRLSVDASGAAPADAFTFNPAQPVEWQPLFDTFSRGANPLPFTLDDGHITGRDDALCYTSAPLGTSLTVLGRPRLQVWFLTDGADTDVVALLSDVFPGSARSVLLAHAIVRAGTVAEFTPGRAVRYVLDFDDIGHEFLPGHALRLTVTSSLFPLYARNLGSNEAYTAAVEPHLALQRLLHDAEHPSVLTLPTSPSDEEHSRPQRS